MYRILFCFVILNVSLFADPWGKDADLVRRESKDIEFSPCSTPILGKLAESAIWFHQNVISGVDGPRSNYRPSSSQYMLDAIRKYGFFRGVPLGCDRLMRENPDPWVYQRTVDEYGNHRKIDPVR